MRYEEALQIEDRGCHCDDGGEDDESIFIKCLKIRMRRSKTCKETRN